jgi:hypothetical protein
MALVSTHLWNCISIGSEDSSEYFGFVCHRAEVKTALLSAAEAFPDQRSRKVRMLLDRNGGLHIEHEVIAEPEGAQTGTLGSLRSALTRETVFSSTRLRGELVMRARGGRQSSGT